MTDKELEKETARIFADVHNLGRDEVEQHKRDFSKTFEWKKIALHVSLKSFVCEFGLALKNFFKR